MALAQIVDSLDSVPEAARGAYVADGDRFRLDFEVEDTTSLKGALEKERKAARDAAKELAKWKASGKTPDEIATLLAEQEEAERKRLEASGDHAKILKQHQDKWEKREAELAGEVAAALASERGAIVGERVIGALAKAGATEEGAELLPDRLAARIKFETVDGKRVLKIVQADGETPMAGSAVDGTATIDDLVKEAITKYPSLFKGSGAGGGGKPPKDGGGGSGATKKSDFKTERERAAWVDKNGFPAYQALPD